MAMAASESRYKGKKMFDKSLNQENPENNAQRESDMNTKTCNKNDYLYRLHMTVMTRTE